jgi:predicted TPR repeat methyltransferase
VTGSKRLLFAKERRGGDVEEALALLNRALELDGDHVMGLVLRGTAHEKLEDFDSAQMDWERALELNPSCKPAKDKLEALSKPAH